MDQDSLYFHAPYKGCVLYDVWSSWNRQKKFYTKRRCKTHKKVLGRAGWEIGFWAGTPSLRSVKIKCPKPKCPKPIRPSEFTCSDCGFPKQRQALGRPPKRCKDCRILYHRRFAEERYQEIKQLSILTPAVPETPKAFLT